MDDIAIVAGFVIAYALVSRRLSTTVITGPMVFVAFGVLVGPDGLDVVDLRVGNRFVEIMAEVALVLLLFNEAAMIDWPVFRRNRETPMRLLGIAMPLSMVFGVAVAWLLVEDIHLWHAALVAAILAPTDAALGQAVVTNERVPARIREALNVESGLNDGIAAPLVTIFLAGAAAEGEAHSAGFWAVFAAKEIGFGVLLGVALGLVGAVAIGLASRFAWTSHTFEQIAVGTVPVLCLSIAGVIEGNAFVAAFVAGITFGNVTRQVRTRIFGFSEQSSQLLLLLTFMIFGGAFVVDAMGELTWQIVLFGVLSLVLIRPLAVLISMVGSKFRPGTSAFMGWFGPRGIASIVFGLSVLETRGLQASELVFVVVTWTVLLSVYAHGLTAKVGADRYADRSETFPEDIETPELDSVEKAFQSAARFVSGGQPRGREPPPSHE